MKSALNEVRMKKVIGLLMLATIMGPGESFAKVSKLEKVEVSGRPGRIVPPAPGASTNYTTCDPHWTEVPNSNPPRFTCGGTKVGSGQLRDYDTGKTH